MNSWIKINLKNLDFNIKHLKNILNPSTDVLAVIKSNAYGHGLEGIASHLKNKVKGFAVLDDEEALKLRSLNIKNLILILSNFKNDNLRKLVFQKISLPIYDITQAKIVSKQALKLKKKAYVHLKIDTGMNRLGIALKDLSSFIKSFLKLKNLELEGVFSHLAASSDLNHSYVKKTAYSI